MKKNQIATLLLLIIVSFSLIQCKSTKETYPENKLDSYLEQQFDNLPVVKNEENKPGFSVIITKKDSIIYSANFGSSNLEDDSLITENTVFDIASLSKQFTGMAIAILEEQGKINMNDRIVKYLPDLPEVMQDITIYQLVHHSSGIRDWPLLFGLKGWQPEDRLAIDDIYELLQKQDGLNFNPGTAFSYSNSNYNLLSKIVVSVTGTPFNEWMHDNLFIPLDMNNTYLVKDNEQNNSELAMSYVFTGENYLTISNNLSAPGSSSICSNAADMSKWLINFYSHSVGGNVFDKITQNGNLTNNETINYGYGLYLSEMQNMKAYVHDGAWAGYRSATAFIPEEAIGIIILSNNASIQAQRMMNDIVGILFDQKENKEENNNEIVEKEINDEFFTLCAGKYEQVDDKGCYLTFYKEGNEYFVNFYDKNYKLYAKSDSVFFVKESEAEIVFHLKNGKVNSHTLKQNGNSYLALKEIENQVEPNINYDKLIGSYYSKELDVKYLINYENDELKLQSTVLQFELILEHSIDLTFTSNSGLVRSISFLEKDGKIIGLEINNPRASNVFFESI